MGESENLKKVILMTGFYKFLIFFFYVAFVQHSRGFLARQSSIHPYSRVIRDTHPHTHEDSRNHGPEWLE